MFKYEWIWQKNTFGNIALVNYAPLRIHESVLVFSNTPASFVKNATCITYNPQKMKGERYKKINKKTNKPSLSVFRKGSELKEVVEYSDRFPTTILDIPNSNHNSKHPTQKPLDLFRYLIRTYSNEGDLVFDGYSGSGTTAHACLVENRNFIGAELNSEYYQTAIQRIELEKNQAKLF
jgi:site-specific DNA-methyltransferase (adenine-specific)